MKWSLNLCNKNLIGSNLMIKNNFLKEVYTATFFQNFKGFLSQTWTFEKLTSRCSMINICFWDFQNHAKNVDSVPLVMNYLCVGMFFTLNWHWVFCLQGTTDNFYSINTGKFH